MAFWIITGGILGASFVAFFIYWIFKFGMKSKSYDEAMAEQRKLERSLMKSKSKQNQSKKPKNLVKENSQSEKRGSKTVPQAATKETKKVESLKNNPVVVVNQVVSSNFLVELPAIRTIHIILGKLLKLNFQKPHAILYSYG